jgi:Pyruvate/2-oxoacid:ferredoxin oxidoreductase gamma subunit
LGAFVKKSGLISLETTVRAVKDTFATRNPGIFKLNQSALSLGYEYLE